MDQNFENLLNVFEEVDNIHREPLINIIRFPKCYLRNIINPYEYFSDEEFKIRYRFSKNTVRTVILPELQELQTINERGLPISLQQQILIALRFFATGSFQLVCADITYISQPAVSHVVARVSRVLAKTLPKYINYPRTPIQLQQIKVAFENLGARRNLPGLKNIVGAIDCTHIKITRPRGLNHTEAYRNRHGWFSINAQFIVGPDMKILDVVVRWPGSSHDSRIFRNSRIHARFINRQIDGILVGDGGYACTAIMLTPLRSPTTQAEEKYNEVQIRTRNVVERAFGVLKRRFACLQRGLSYKLTTSCNIILACSVLHNLALLHENQDEINLFTELPSNAEIEVPHQQRQNAAEGLTLRSEIIRTMYS